MNINKKQTDIEGWGELSFRIENGEYDDLKRGLVDLRTDQNNDLWSLWSVNKSVLKNYGS